MVREKPGSFILSQGKLKLIYRFSQAEKWSSKVIYSNAVNNFNNRTYEANFGCLCSFDPKLHRIRVGLHCNANEKGNH